MIAPNDWDLSDDLSYDAPPPITSRRDDSANHPVNLESPIYPVEGRAVILHVLVAVALPCIFFVGKLLHHSGYLPELIVGSSIVGFIAGLTNYLNATNLRAEIATKTPGLRRSDLPPSPSLVGTMLVPVAVFPIVVTTVSVYAVWSQNHFVAITLPAILCLYAFYRLGGTPVEFWQEYTLAQPEIDPKLRHAGERFLGTPDLKLLATILFVLVTAPILLSAAWTYTILLALLFVTIRAKLNSLGHANSVALLAYLLRRCHHLMHVYLDYRNVALGEERDQWLPPSSRVERFITFVGLLSTVFLVLLTGLTYYCPWDFFAAIFVPGFKTAYFVLPAESPVGYQWLLKPLELAFQAKPVAGYLLAFVAAIAGALLFPPAMLFALYFERIVLVEALHQEAKAVRRSYE